MNPLSSHSVALQPPHIPVFDSLRGYAICGVLLVHCALPFMSSFNTVWATNIQYGATGVQLFYIVSACTLFWSISSRNQIDSRPFAAFMLRRLFRIAPAFWLAIGVSLLLNGRSPRFNAPDGLSLFDIVSTITFTHGLYPTSINSLVPGGWSIAVEMPFYVLLPLCFKWIRTLSAAIRFTFFAFLFGRIADQTYMLFFARQFPGDHRPLLEQFVRLWLPSQLPVFGVGMILYFLIRDRLRRSGEKLSTFAPVLHIKPDYLLLWSLLAWGCYTLIKRGELIIPHLLAIALLQLFFCWMLVWWPVPALVNRAICHVGKISYSMYLSHFFLIACCVTYALPHLGGYPPAIQYLVLSLIVFTMTIALSTLTYLLIERPMIRLGKSLIESLKWGPLLPEDAKKNTSASTAPL